MGQVWTYCVRRSSSSIGGIPGASSDHTSHPDDGPPLASDLEEVSLGMSGLQGRQAPSQDDASISTLFTQHPTSTDTPMSMRPRHQDPLGMILHESCNIPKVTHFPSQVGQQRRWFQPIFFWRGAKKQDQNRSLVVEVKARVKIIQQLKLRRSSEDVTAIVMGAFATGDHVKLNCLRGDQAQSALDLLQELLCNEYQSCREISDPIWKESRWLLQRRIQKLSCEALLLPSQVYVTGVKITTKRTLGHGGYADVYPGACEGSNVAVKHLRAFNSLAPSHAETLKREFYREAVLWFNLRHKHVLAFKGISEEPEGLPGLSMILQWAKNQDLRRYLDILVRNGLEGPLYVTKVNAWLHAVALGLEYLHCNGVVHGDLRGANVLIDAEETVLLADFGLSIIADVGMSYTYPSSGKSVAWAAPELLDSHSGTARPSFKSDIYSFGCTCVELYLNGPLFREPELREYQIICQVLKGKRPKRPRIEGRQVTNELWAVIKACWKQDPLKRPDASEAVRLFFKATRTLHPDL